MNSIPPIPSKNNPYLNTFRFESNIPSSIKTESFNAKKILEYKNEPMILDFPSNTIENVEDIQGFIEGSGPFGGRFLKNREVVITFKCSFPKDFFLYISANGGSEKGIFQVLIGNDNQKNRHTKELTLFPGYYSKKMDTVLEFNNTQEDNNILSIQQIIPAEPHKTRLVLHSLKILPRKKDIPVLKK